MRFVRTALACVAGVLLALWSSAPAFAVGGPTLTSPAASARVGGSISVAYTLPTTPDNGTVTMSFAPSGGGTPITFGLALEAVGSSNTTTLTTANLPGSTDARPPYSATAIPDGTYDVTLSYDDTGSPQSTTNSGVVVDTVTSVPTLSSPTSNATVADPTNATFNFTLPEAPTAGTVILQFISTTGGGTRNVTLQGVGSGVSGLGFSLADPASDSDVASVSPAGAIPNGTYNVRLRYQDDLGNPASYDEATDVTYGPASTPSPVPSPSTQPEPSPSTQPEPSPSTQPAPSAQPSPSTQPAPSAQASPSTEPAPSESAGAPLRTVRTVIKSVSVPRKVKRGKKVAIKVTLTEEAAGTIVVTGPGGFKKTIKFEGDSKVTGSVKLKKPGKYKVTVTATVTDPAVRKGTQTKLTTVTVKKRKK